MHSVLVALALAGQYPSPQAPQQQVTSVPAQLVYSVPAPTYSAPQVVTLGAGQVMQAGPVGQMLGHLGRKLEKHSWPRMQPLAAQPAPIVQTVYVAIQQPQPVMQATYAVQQPLPQLPVGVPQTPAKSPQQPAYGSPQYQQQQPQQPQSQQYGASKPSEDVPPVPKR